MLLFLLKNISNDGERLSFGEVRGSQPGQRSHGLQPTSTPPIFRQLLQLHVPLFSRMMFSSLYSLNIPADVLRGSQPHPFFTSYHTLMRTHTSRSPPVQRSPPDTDLPSVIRDRTQILSGAVPVRAASGFQTRRNKIIQFPQSRFN